MGALTAARREAAEERYSATEGVGEKPLSVDSRLKERNTADGQSLWDSLQLFDDCLRVHDPHVSLYRDLPRSTGW